MKRPSVLTLTGPSCSGKTTLANAVVAALPFQFAMLRSFTTRDPRPGEVDGREYDFISAEEAAELMMNDQVVQHVEFKGAMYGTSVAQLEELMDAGRIGITVVEPSGVEQFRRAASQFDFNYAAIYVGGKSTTLLERWFDRIEAEIDRCNGDPDALLSKLAYLRGRMVAGLTEELTWDTAAQYDFQIASFSEANHHSATGFVTDIGLQLSRDEAKAGAA